MEKATCPLKVNVRIRPADSETVLTLCENDDTFLAIGEKGYIFDKIFKEGETQQNVYIETVKPFVEKVLSGYSCTVLAYGQTGTGKTYTMFGKNIKFENDVNSGLISRALEDIFAQISENCKLSDVKVEISFIEIYNQKIFDLLRPNRNNKSEWTIKHSKIEPSVYQEVKMVAEAQELLSFGVRNRHIGETKMNSQSSRSHTIFTIQCTLRNTAFSCQISKLNLVDLGGSENIKRTGNEGIARLEGIHINQSLLALRQVLIALSRNYPVIPFRDSLLTTVLHESLTVKNYIVFIACISPQADDYSETINTLRFAESTKQIKSKPEIEVIMNNFKEKNANQIEKTRLLIPPMSHRTPARFNKLNNTISTPGYKSIKRRYNLASINNTYSPANPKYTFLEPLSSIKKPRNLPNLNEDKVEDNGFELDAANLSTSTVIDPDPPTNTYSPIVRKCTATLEKQIHTLVNKQLTTISRRKSMRILLKSAVETPPEETPKLRLSSIMRTVEQRIQEVVEQKLSEMTQKMSRYSKASSYKEYPQPKKLFPDTPMSISVDTNEDVEEKQMQENVRINREDDSVFKVPQITVRRTKHRQSKRVSRRLTNKENEPPTLKIRRSTRCSMKLPDSSVEVSSRFTNKENEPSTLKIRRSTRCSMKLLDSNVEILMEKRPIKTPKRYSPSINENSVKRKPRKLNQKDIFSTIPPQITTPFNPKKSNELPKASINFLDYHRTRVLQILNTGFEKELQSLITVGPKTASQIISYRSIHGNINSIEELKKFSFWTPKQLDKFLLSNCLVTPS